mmetsp:Transcript_28610/g.65402  ORF Transcript_28610/g.65402 Transcript_28610/m.65402 type:complete len:89 (+) Transcript_28610:907-1173(+)
MLQNTGAQSHQLGHPAGIQPRSDGVDETVKESGGTGPVHGFCGEDADSGSQQLTWGKKKTLRHPWIVAGNIWPKRTSGIRQKKRTDSF